jgi:hypothetical protein
VRLLLDECVPKRLRRELEGHSVRTTPEMGWAGLRNGELLRRAEHQFDVFITVDQNLEFQQNLEGFSIGIVLLVATSNDINALRPLMPQVLERLSEARPGKLVRIGA